MHNLIYNKTSLSGTPLSRISVKVDTFRDWHIPVNLEIFQLFWRNYQHNPNTFPKHRRPHILPARCHSPPPNHCLSRLVKHSHLVRQSGVSHCLVATVPPEGDNTHSQYLVFIYFCTRLDTVLMWIPYLMGNGCNKQKPRLSRIIG